MRIYIDECVSPIVYQQIKLLYPKLTVDHHSDLPHLSGLKDRPLFEHLGANDYDAIVTHDMNHMSRKAEVEALLANKIHWIGVKQPSAVGVVAFAQISAAVSGAIGALMGSRPVETQKIMAKLPNMQPSSSSSLLEHYHQPRIWKDEQERLP